MCLCVRGVGVDLFLLMCGLGLRLCVGVGGVWCMADVFVWWCRGGGVHG